MRPPRDARPSAGRRRRRARVLERAAGSLPAGQGGSLLVPQDRQRPRRAAEVSPPGAKKALAEIWNAEDRTHALTAVKAFQAAYGAKFPKATAKITDDARPAAAFYDYPAEHWVHLRTTNPIESTFATVRHRTKITKDPARGPPGWRSRSSSSTQRKTAGAPSTPPTSSPWSAPGALNHLRLAWAGCPIGAGGLSELQSRTSFASAIGGGASTLASCQISRTVGVRRLLYFVP